MENYGFNVVWSDEDGSYVATSPEFPGLSALAETADGALRELRRVIEAALEGYDDEGWPRPVPRVQQIHSGQFRLRVPKSLHAELAAYAESEGVSLNTLAVTLLSQGIGAAGVAARVSRQLREAVDATPAVRSGGSGGSGFRTPSWGMNAVVGPTPAEYAPRETRMLTFPGQPDNPKDTKPQEVG